MILQTRVATNSIKNAVNATSRSDSRRPTVGVAPKTRPWDQLDQVPRYTGYWVVAFEPMFILTRKA